MTERLHFDFHFHALEEEMATHSSVLAWRIPWTEEPGGLQSMGSHRVGHDWSDLAAVAAICIYIYTPHLYPFICWCCSKDNWDLLLSNCVKNLDLQEQLFPPREVPLYGETSVGYHHSPIQIQAQESCCPFVTWDFSVAGLWLTHKRGVCVGGDWILFL